MKSNRYLRNLQTKVVFYPHPSKSLTCQYLVIKSSVVKKQPPGARQLFLGSLERAICHLPWACSEPRSQRKIVSFRPFSWKSGLVTTIPTSRGLWYMPLVSPKDRLKWACYASGIRFFLCRKLDPHSWARSGVEPERLNAFDYIGTRPLILSSLRFSPT